MYKKRIYKLFKSTAKVMRTTIKDLRKGNHFYAEESDVELVTYRDGRFIFKAAGKPYKLKGIWTITVDPVS